MNANGSGEIVAPRRVGACTHCGIVVVRELDAWIGSLSGSLHCLRSPSRRHEPHAVSGRSKS